MPYLIRLILIVFGLYLLGYLIFRIIFPRLLKWFIKRKLKQKGFDFDNHNKKKSYKKQGKKEGDVNINHIPDEKGGKNSNSDGEYVDYEEL